VTHFSGSLGAATAPLLEVVFRLLKAFNHFDFMLPVEEADILRSRDDSATLSTFEANNSF
jgi:hypothetical protein